MSKIDYKIIRCFGPSVLEVDIPKEIIEKLNNFTDNVVSNKDKSKELDNGYSLVGDVTQEIKLTKEIIEDSGWLKFLAFCTKNWIKEETGKEIKTFNLLNSWIVRQFENEYNPTHWHGGHISGAGYLKVPKSLGNHFQKKEYKEYRGGNLQLIHGSRMFLCHSTLNITPKVGKFYFFPNYMMHTVFPFKNSNEERRSVSFNANIDEQIYNVYGK